MLSRVVPGSFAVIASRLLSTALKRLDLPTLARPTIAIIGTFVLLTSYIVAKMVKIFAKYK
jgi:hypothetical protein